jgi:hypothetical protein
MILPLLALLVVGPRAPDPGLTPGVARPLTRAAICTTAWGRDRRHVTEAKKRDVARRYGLKRTDIKPRGKGPCCEFDHLIPRELGGADDVDNLWPQSWREASQKDVEENRLHRAVCAGDVSLTTAQRQMRHWRR